MTDLSLHWTKSHDWLINLLKQGVVSVSFTKKDGTDRLMRCTLNPELIPEQPSMAGSNRKRSENNIVVYDVEVGGWRSFIFSSVKTIIVKFDGPPAAKH